MKKILILLLFIMSFQAIAETIVIGEYQTKKGRYVQLTQIIEKEINLNYKAPTDKNETVIYRTKNYDIVVNKSDLLALYSNRRTNELTKIKNIISYNDKKVRIHNEIATLIEQNKATIYDRKTKEEIKTAVKVKYNNVIYYDSHRGGGGSAYNGYFFYTDKSLKNSIMRFDVVTKFGIEVHSRLGQNPYNREVTNKGKIKNYDELKELYEKSVQFPDVEHEIRF